MELKKDAKDGLGGVEDVSIAPLWNWKLRVACMLSAAGGLNRTFMELKCGCILVGQNKVVSQSYLYGIEIWKILTNLFICRRSQSYLYGIEMHAVGSVTPQQIAPQSYLYGIEIPPMPLQGLAITVSIVPLWNWNLSSTTLSVTQVGLNRTFMELKYNYRASVEAATAVSIVPLWNWNFCSFSAPLGLTLGLNRTFMELKCHRSHTANTALSFKE